MKRKDALATIGDVAGMTFLVEGRMSLVNNESGAEVEFDMQMLLAAVRGVLAWCGRLLDDETANDLSAIEQLQRLLADVGKAVAADISQDEER